MAFWFWVFFFYSFFGCLLEHGFAAATRAPQRTRRCLLVLPLCPVYGLGVAAILALPPSMRAGLWLPLAGGVVSTAVEYVYDWVCESLLGVRFWDYTGVSGNLQGRVCLPFSLAWGALSAAALWLIQPPLALLISRIPPLVTYAALLALTADAACSLRILAATGSVDALRA